MKRFNYSEYQSVEISLLNIHIQTSSIFKRRSNTIDIHRTCVLMVVVVVVSLVYVGMIFYKSKFASQINNAVFPALQGGPHEHQIAGIATQLKEVQMPYFKTYIQQVKANAQTLARALMKRNYVMATNGTDNHLILWDLRPVGITGSKMEKLCDAVGITLNKNAVLGKWT